MVAQTETRRYVELIAHLMRRAGFGATHSEIRDYAEAGYEAIVERLINPPDTSWAGNYLVR
ncbi:MAG: DUF1800 domain-containing protein, partial [Dehalococcoidia bacterium]|nr:DUF1800 domain-containing protein [Dehalococcoidia bacterium]